ncbi:MAG TPA: NAD-binding protein, partial [Candidatus Dormibacteraeota bacterium]|nr:NAD-binding protein [Candidatus Dormibacteraeota bacterium]
MRTVIVGCGRVGASLARQLSDEGDNVTVVDSNEAAFNRLGEDFTGEMVFGTAVDEDILRQAGTENADAFVAVTDADTTNIMVDQI